MNDKRIKFIVHTFNNGFNAFCKVDDINAVKGCMMNLFGEPYPRGQARRNELLEELKSKIKSLKGKHIFDNHDERFYEWLRKEENRWEIAADNYAKKLDAGGGFLTKE